MTTEPPRGIKANLKRVFADKTDDFFADCEKPAEFRKLTWALSYFHSIIQERKKFGPLGWNIKYAFNVSDLETSLTVLQMLLNEHEEIPWDALLFLNGEINYGGRVTDDRDRTCLMSVLSMLYTPKILRSDTYQFSESTSYIIPKNGSFDDIQAYIDGLSLEDDPDIFGMHENANITFQTQESNKIIHTILAISPADAGGEEGVSPDEVVKSLIKMVQKELPQKMVRKETNAP